MGFFDKIKQAAKDATGLGLNAQQQYLRAYQKGVFLKDYGSAAKNFAKAAEKFTEDNNPAMAQRANANAMVYSLLAPQDRPGLDEVIAALGPVPEIEQVGSDKEMVATKPWVTELNALRMEQAAAALTGDGDKKVAYQQASDLLMGMASTPLTFADKLGLAGPKDKAMARANYYAGLSDYHGANAELLTSPSSAHDYLQKAAVRLRTAGVGDLAKQIEDLMEAWKQKRHCWMCGREMQARDVFFRYYPTVTRPYNLKQVEAVSGDVHMLERENHVTLCTVCGSAVEFQADRYAKARAQEVRVWAEGVFAEHRRALEALHERIKALERAAHTH
jgi:hypothetical protein